MFFRGSVIPNATFDAMSSHVSVRARPPFNANSSHVSLRLHSGFGSETFWHFFLYFVLTLFFCHPTFAKSGFVFFTLFLIFYWVCWLCLSRNPMCLCLRCECVCECVCECECVGVSLCECIGWSGCCCSGLPDTAGPAPGRARHPGRDPVTTRAGTPLRVVGPRSGILVIYIYI